MNHGCPNRHKCHSECTQDWWCSHIRFSEGVSKETGNDCNVAEFPKVRLAFYRDSEHDKDLRKVA